MRSFKSNENIHKKEGGSYYIVSANKASYIIKLYINGFVCSRAHQNPRWDYGDRNPHLHDQRDPSRKSVFDGLTSIRRNMTLPQHRSDGETAVRILKTGLGQSRILVNNIFNLLKFRKKGISEEYYPTCHLKCICTSCFHYCQKTGTSIPSVLSGKKLLKNVTLQMLNFISVSYKY